MTEAPKQGSRPPIITAAIILGCAIFASSIVRAATTPRYKVLGDARENSNINTLTGEMRYCRARPDEERGWIFYCTEWHKPKDRKERIR